MRLNQTDWQAKMPNIGEVNRDIWFEIPRAMRPLVWPRRHREDNINIHLQK